MQSFKTFLIAFVAGLVVFTTIAVICYQFFTKDNSNKAPVEKQPAISVQIDEE